MNQSHSDRAVSKTEFIALTDMMFSIVAFSVDAMLPAMPQIARDLGLENAQHAPLVVTSFLLGLGVATLIAGPLSDAFGRRPIVFGGLAIYAAGAAVAWQAQSFETMIAARFLQGMGAAGPRVVCLAIVRDRFSGTEMARVMSLALVLFLAVPALAPMMGAFTMRAVNWYAIFAIFIAFSLILMIWFGLRQAETLPSHERRPLRLGHLLGAAKEIFANPTTRIAIMIQTLIMAMLFSVLTMVQPIFDITFGRADSFPYWFGALAVASSVSSFANAQMVGRFGMRRLITWALWFQVVASSAALLLFLTEQTGTFWIYLFWQFGVLLQAGLTTANLNTLAMEPMGHIAGATSSVIGAVSTIGGAVLASVFAPFFDGTPIPLFGIALALAALSVLLITSMKRKEAARTPDASPSPPAPF